MENSSNRIFGTKFHHEYRDVLISFEQNLCSPAREVLKCTMRYSSSFEDDRRGLIMLGFRSPLAMLPGAAAAEGGLAPEAAYESAPHFRGCRGAVTAPLRGY